ncbi:MAG: UDP-N-acetylmuramoyl-L-alanine--D-glutamate ligase [Bacilli bacterium]|nr:UDP-N-acetylmuramoyl-L-alanine--D-glutamate ligase [Bacilli bacterium]
MINAILDYLKDKKIAILGFGLEGKSTYNFLRRHLPNKLIAIIDQNETLEKMADKNVEYVLGKNYLDNLNDYEVVIKTPGICLIDKEYKCEIVSQFALLLNLTKTFVIGVTGTKGKSTTTSLIYEIIKEQKDNVYLVGNIGIPIFDLIDDFNEESIIVAEMSGHQLYDIKRSPNIGIITNLFEEHLDYFKTLDNYYHSKLNMFRYQNEDAYGIYLKDNDDLTYNIAKTNIKSTLIGLGKDNVKDNKICLEDSEVFDLNIKRNLIGDFNNLNIMMALEVAKLLNLDLEKARQTIIDFKGLEHRMSLIATVNDISFYDDTLATIPAATQNSVLAISNVETLIIGGMDRNINYDSFIDFLANSQLKNIICQPNTGKYIYEKLINKCQKNIYYIEDLEEAVNKAFEITQKNKAVLLSPAAPSYNVFKNYADKSKHYQEYILKHQNKN